jgi:arylsulfatase A-like enzyme
MLRRPVLCCLLSLTTVISAVSSAATKPNVILVTLDSTRADRVGFLGSRKGLTPSLDSLARQAMVFEHAYSQAPLTVESTATILTGVYPQTHRASALSVPLAATIPYLPDLLHGGGYRTAAFVGSILLDPRNGPFQGYARGFDSYDAAFHLPRRGEDRYQSVERQGSQVVARAAKWLESRPQGPFFLWVHLQDPHAPYASYDRAIAAEDAAAGKLLNALRDQKLYDAALIVIASDHGEALGSHAEDTHGFFLYDDTIHVPLVVKLPQNKTAGKRVSNHARLLDVAPAILEAAGIPVPSQMQGQSLLRIAQASSQADQPAYARTDLPQQGFACSQLESWRAGKYLYVRAPRPELYDLSSDPEATRNLAQNSKAVLDTLAAQLQAFDNRFTKDGGTAVSGLTPSQVQLLASLGYVGVAKSPQGVPLATTGTDPKDFIALANQTLAAISAIEDGKPEKATASLRLVLKNQQNIYLAQYGMGVALVQQQQYSEAIAYLHKAIELQPTSAWAQYEMGLSLVKTGEFKTAALHLEIASSRLPAFAALHSTLADVYSHLGRNEDANRERTQASQ